MAVNKNADKASSILQQSLEEIQECMKKWRIMASENKSAHITFTLKKAKCPSVSLNDRPIPQTAVVKYLGIHLDQRLTYAPHIIKENS